jgi:hypothetical protein
VAVSVLSPTFTAAEPATTDGADGAFGATVSDGFTVVVVVVEVSSGVVVDGVDFDVPVINGICD